MRCPRSEIHVDQCLQSLPRTLDETYERILCNIDKNWIEDVRRILTFLCFSSRPLTVQELIDVVAVELHDPACLNPLHRLCDADDFHKLCPGLIDVVDDETQIDSDRDKGMKSMMSTLRIAHFSVQEYLESDRIREQKADTFALESTSAHTEIAEVCLVYLQEPRLSSGTLDQTKLEEFPLAHFAAMFWHHHYINAVGMRSRLDSLILRLFQQQDSLYVCVRLHNPDEPWQKRVQFLLDPGHIAPPVYYASLLGLDEVLHRLINVYREHASERRNLINTQGGTHNTALQAASTKGHNKIVQMLINAGDDMEFCINALQAASAYGHDQIVQILIDAGADVNVQGGDYGNALRAASFYGYDQTVKVLIDAGADVHARGGCYDSALEVALVNGHHKTAQVLIDAGAKVQGTRYYGSALQAALVKGHDQTVQVLIDAGANVNAPGSEFDGNALQAASAKGLKKIVQMLIEAGADI